MKVAYFTPEFYPLAKTGGLGDVAAALPQALAHGGAAVTVYLPAYRSVLAWCLANGIELTRSSLPGTVDVTGQQHALAYATTAWRAVQLVLVEHGAFFDRPHPYLGEDKRDYPDNLARYAYFCQAALRHLAHAGGCDILHLNDWQTSLAAAYVRLGTVPDLPGNMRSVLTVHNLGYQGVFPVEDYPATGLDWQHFNHEELEFYGQTNLLKGGIVYADAVTTVSPTYAAEIQTPALGHGLDGVLRVHAGKLTGILNGIDSGEWDPRMDIHLPANFDATDFAGKQQCKKALQRLLGLPLRPRSLLLGCISRLDRQKGIDLIFAAFPELAALDIQLVLLGSGAAELEETARGLARQAPQQAAVHIGYDETLAHLIEAGADLFLMPSLYEPCGLNQLYSQRYGTLPVVRETGGLRDTVQNIGATGSGSGFTFAEPTATALAEAVRRAAQLYFANRRRFNALARGAMSLDNSWSNRAQEYLQLFAQLQAAAAPSVQGVAL